MNESVPHAPTNQVPNVQVKATPHQSSILLRMSWRRERVLKSRALSRIDSFAYRVSQSIWFDRFFFMLIVASAIWIGVSLDEDPSLALPIDVNDRPAESEYLLEVVENILCSLFTLELVVRMSSYKHPLNFFIDPLKRKWNIMDFIVLIIMIVDIWILSFTEHDETLTIRILRISRLVRLSRIMSVSHELRILFRAMMGSVKSVLVSAVPLLSLNYGFAVIMTDWCKSPGTDYYARYGEYFGSVIDSMLTLWQLAQFDNCFPSSDL